MTRKTKTFHDLRTEREIRIILKGKGEPHATVDDPYYQKTNFTTWSIPNLERWIREARTRWDSDGFANYYPSSPTDIAQAKKTLKEKLDAQG